MTGRRAWWTAVALVAALVGGCSDDGDPDAEAAGNETTTTTPPVVGEPGGPTLGELVAGTSQVVDGTWVWTDYVYDDRGANTDAGDRTVIDDAGGDATYPEGLETTADIVQVQVRPLDDATEITVVLETLIDPDVAYAAVEVLRDGAEPVQIQLASSPQGTIETTVDAARNTMTAAIPLDQLPRDRPWGVRVASGIELAASDDATPPNLFDLAFVADEPYQWQDYLQADILGGKSPREDATATIDWDDLDDRAPDGRSPGFHTYLYRSELDLGEGIRPAERGLQYLGPYQPYLVYLPDDGVDPHRALTVFLHGLEQNHLGSVNTGGVYAGTARPLSTELHQLAQFARDGLDFAPHNMTVWPLARGEGLSYRGIAERDVLDVMDDAVRRLDPDPDRIVLEGASMGGIGAFRLGALHPDRFSAVVPVIGYATDDVEPLLTNLWHVPIRQINGAEDPLIPAASATATTDLLDRLELGFDAWMLDGRGHEAGGYVYDCVYAALPQLVRVTNPARVRLTASPAIDAEGSADDLGLPRGAAYWVSGLTPATSDGIASIDVVSEALPRPARVEAEHVDERNVSEPPGADLCGPNPDVVTSDTWRERAVVRRPSGEAPAAQRIEGTVTGATTVTLDLGRAGIAAGDGGELILETDRSTEVGLSGLEPGGRIRLSDRTWTADADGEAVVTLAAGRNVVELP